jgi:hypothetical protein
MSGSQGCSNVCSVICVEQLRLTYISETQSHAFTHLSFALVFGLCAYNFFRAITLDAGSCPKPTSDAELKSVNNAFNFFKGILLITRR